MTTAPTLPYSKQVVTKLQNDISNHVFRRQRQLEQCREAVECMVTILNDYRAASDFDARLDAWFSKYAFVAEE